MADATRQLEVTDDLPVSTTLVDGKGKSKEDEGKSKEGKGTQGVKRFLSRVPDKEDDELLTGQDLSQQGAVMRLIRHVSQNDVSVSYKNKLVSSTKLHIIVDKDHEMQENEIFLAQKTIIDPAPKNKQLIEKRPAPAIAAPKDIAVSREAPAAIIAPVKIKPEIEVMDGHDVSGTEIQNTFENKRTVEEAPILVLPRTAEILLDKKESETKKTVFADKAPVVTVAPLQIEEAPETNELIVSVTIDAPVVAVAEIEKPKQVVAVAEKEVAQKIVADLPSDIKDEVSPAAPKPAPKVKPETVAKVIKVKEPSPAAPQVVSEPEPVFYAEPEIKAVLQETMTELPPEINLPEMSQQVLPDQTVPEGNKNIVESQLSFSMEEFSMEEMAPVPEQEELTGIVSPEPQQIVAKTSTDETKQDWKETSETLTSDKPQLFVKNENALQETIPPLEQKQNRQNFDVLFNNSGEAGINLNDPRKAEENIQASLYILRDNMHRNELEICYPATVVASIPPPEPEARSYWSRVAPAA